MLFSIAAIAMPIFFGWLIPGLGKHLPHGWDRMKANTAVLILLCASSLFLANLRGSNLAGLAARLLGLCVFGIAAYTFAESFYPRLWRIDTLFGGADLEIEFSRPSAQACFGFMLIGVVLSHIRASGRRVGGLVDLCTLLVGLYFLSLVGSMVLERSVEPGRSVWYHLAPQSFFCLGLITVLVFYRRSGFGVFSVLRETGIGGKVARRATPVAILLPFAIDTSQVVIVHFHLLPKSYAIAVVPSTVAMLAFCLVLALAKRSGELEDAVRELSLRDELTRLYNRRGFLMLAEQTLRDTRRDGVAFSVLFIDVDNLKATNDALGHDVGSELLREIARLLENSFRESDVIGRVGGDEFIVALRADEAKLTHAISRLADATTAANRTPGRRYQISYSLGHITRLNPTESLERLIESADNLMYQAKREKRLQGNPMLSSVSGG